MKHGSIKSFFQENLFWGYLAALVLGYLLLVLAETAYYKKGGARLIGSLRQKEEVIEIEWRGLSFPEKSLLEDWKVEIFIGWTDSVQTSSKFRSVEEVIPILIFRTIVPFTQGTFTYIPVKEGYYPVNLRLLHGNNLKDSGTLPPLYYSSISRSKR